MNAADTAWMLISTALVLLMTPALAFFYGGLVRSKNALNTMMMSFISLGFVGVLWAVVGYSLAFAPGNDWIGDLSRLFLHGVGLEAAGHDPALPVHVLPGHVRDHHRGADLRRDRRAHALLAPTSLFISLWAIVVYSPVAHWVWGGGWLAKMGALDFAGGTVVHVNAGVAALVAAIVRRARAATIKSVAAAAAQRAVHAARRRPAVVRLVRVQRRQRAGRQRHRRARLHHHDAGAGRHAGGLDAARRGASAASRPPSAPPRRSSSAWWRSRRRPASSGR